MKNLKKLFIMVKGSKWYEIIVREEVHKHIAAIFVLMAFLDISGILYNQCGWSAEDFQFYYAHGGLEYSFWCIVILPLYIAFGLGTVELLFVLSYPPMKKPTVW